MNNQSTDPNRNYQGGSQNSSLKPIHPDFTNRPPPPQPEKYVEPRQKIEEWVKDEPDDLKAMHQRTIHNGADLEKITSALRENGAPCPCAGQIRCPDCNDLEGLSQDQLSIMDNLQMDQCPCAPRVNCPNCFLAHQMKKMHIQSYQEAQMDEQIEGKLEQYSDLQTKLYEKSKELAQEIKTHEEAAKQAADTLSQESDAINSARYQMEDYYKKAAQISLKQIGTVKQNPLHLNSPNSNIKIQQVGMKKTELIDTQPEYAITMNITDPEEDPQIYGAAADFVSRPSPGISIAK